RLIERTRENLRRARAVEVHEAGEVLQVLLERVRLLQDQLARRTIRAVARRLRAANRRDLAAIVQIDVAEKDRQDLRAEYADVEVAGGHTSRRRASIASAVRLRFLDPREDRLVIGRREDDGLRGGAAAGDAVFR